MAEPRKIVLILGNGFDLDLGLKTSYKDFWESEFCPKHYPAPLIYHLNQRWKDNRDSVKWYDLENELLYYYKSMRDPNLGADILTMEEKNFLKDFTPYGYACGWYDEKTELLESLVRKGVLLYSENPLPRMHDLFKDDALQSPIWRDRKAFNLIKEGLCKYLSNVILPQNYSSTIAYQVLDCISKEISFGHSVSIYSFNYTPILLTKGSSKKSKEYHMHGSCEGGNIIIGTRDDQTMAQSYAFLQKSFDPYFAPPPLVQDLKEADEVVIFGHSIGENDSQYFRAFFKQQTDYTNDCRRDVTIFTRDEDSVTHIKYALQKMTDGNLSTLFSHNNIELIKTNRIKEDQNKLYRFLVYHGKDNSATNEFISNLLQA